MSTFKFRASPAILAVATIPTWLSMMDTTILNVGYDNIVASLGATLDEVSWASTAYTLAGITMLPLTGWIVARFGRRRVFLAIVALFTAGSALCAFAATATELGIFRLLQGVGGGLLSTVSQAVFLDAYPDEERDSAMNLLSIVVMVGPVAAPVVAGIILQRFDWPFLFLINVPLGILTLWLAAGVDLDQKSKKAAAAFSPRTLVLLFGTLLCFQFVLQSGQRLDWLDSAIVRWALAGGTLLAAALVYEQARVASPMIDLRLFRNRDFSVGTVLTIVAGGSNYAIAFVGPLFLQQILGFSALQAGLMTIPAAIGMLVGNRLQDPASKRISLYVIVSAGMLLLAAALWYNGVYADLNSFESITWLRVLQGFSIGIFMLPIGILPIKTIDRSDIDSASGLSGLVRQISGMAGIALVADLIERSQNVYFRRLLSGAPRWPMKLHAGTPPDVAGVLAARSTVLAYQHVFALCAIAMVACAAGVALYGVWEWLSRQNVALTTVDPSANRA